jgi:predicted  nucleic acid-binding Zn-ribbon protein
MSEAEEHDSVRVSADGVRVLKRFAADQFPVPAIAFEISSGRDEPVTLRLSDQVPQGVAVDDLGFHPDFGSEHWTIEQNRITFERELEANGSYTTVYGIRAADNVGQFLTDPTIESVTPPLSGADSEDSIVLESDDALVEDAISRGVEPTEEDDDESTEEPDVPSTLDLGDPADDGGDEETDEETQAANSADPPTDSADPPTDSADPPTDRADPPTDRATDAAKPAVQPAAEGSVVTSLATELRNETVSQEDIDLLREVLVEEHEQSGSTTARLDRLQQDVAELRAYTGAIEEFLDENGTGAQLIDSFEERLDAFDDRLEHLETEFVVEVRGRIDDLEEQFDRLESNIAEEFDRLDDIEDRTEEVAERADDADARTTELVGRLDELESELDELERIDDIETKLERLDEIDSELTDIQEWREQLINTLGG